MRRAILERPRLGSAGDEQRGHRALARSRAAADLVLRRVAAQAARRPCPVAGAIRRTHRARTGRLGGQRDRAHQAARAARNGRRSALRVRRARGTRQARRTVALATADALSGDGQSSRAIRLAQKLVESGRRDARVSARLSAGRSRRVDSHGKGRDLDPALVAAIIRQESSFNPRAVSVAGARGLMQVLPSVGTGVSRDRSRYPGVVSRAALRSPTRTSNSAPRISRRTVKQYGPLPRVLAAYNAGGSRVDALGGAGRRRRSRSCSPSEFRSPRRGTMCGSCSGTRRVSGALRLAVGTRLAALAVRTLRFARGEQRGLRRAVRKQRE